MKRIIFVLFLVLGIFNWETGIVLAESAPTDQLVKTYHKAKTPEAKIEALGNLLQLKTASADVAFYELAEKANRAELNVFREAIKRNGTCELQVHLFDLLQKKTEPLIKKTQKQMRKHPDEDFEAKLEAEAAKITLRLEQDITDPLDDALTANASKHADCLVENIKTLGASENPEACRGALIGLILIEEKGFATLLKSCPSGPERFGLIHLMPTFDGFAVRPLAEAYRDAPSEVERASILFLIQSLPDTPGVITKSVETYLLLSSSPGTKPASTESKKLDWLDLLFKRYRGNKEAMQVVASQRHGDADLEVGTILIYLSEKPAK